VTFPAKMTGMPRIRGESPGLGAGAEQAALLYVAANAPLGFQRTLMPRGTIDQALVTGLSAATSNALVAAVQDSIQAATVLMVTRLARGPLSGRSMRLATAGTDLAALGAGLALQRSFTQRPDERLSRAALRTSGYWLSVVGTAGALANIVNAMSDDGSAKRARIYVGIVGTAGALAAGGEFRRRRLARLDADLPSDEAPSSGAKAALFGAGVAAASTGIGRVERVTAEMIGGVLARVLPGSRSVWRPAGHIASLGAIAAGTRALLEHSNRRIVEREESVEAAFDIEPPNHLVSGSAGSLVSFDTLSRQGRRFVWTVLPRGAIESVMREQAVDAPIRAYVGLESAPTPTARVDLALRELDRTGAFARGWLLVDAPTGTGYVNYAAVEAFELLTRGNCATLALQYSARPSVLSLDRIGEGRRQMRLLIAALKARLMAIEPETRPKVVLFGESLGAWTSQDPFVGLGTRGLVDAGIDHALWIGTPHMSKWKNQVLAADGSSDTIDPGVVGVFDHVGQLVDLADDERKRLRYCMITHDNDAVALFGPELVYQAPSWLGAPDTRPPRVPRGMRWMPVMTFFQALVDMKNSANIVPGKFAATGHDYRADLRAFLQHLLHLSATEEQARAMDEWLQARERQRTNWIHEHGVAGKSMAATLVQRWLDEHRDDGSPDDLRALIRKVAFEEFGAAGGAASE
jgi:uncharacterized membrane protein